MRGVAQTINSHRWFFRSTERPASAVSVLKSVSISIVSENLRGARAVSRKHEQNRRIPIGWSPSMAVRSTARAKSRETAGACFRLRLRLSRLASFIASIFRSQPSSSASSNTVRACKPCWGGRVPLSRIKSSHSTIVTRGAGPQNGNSFSRENWINSDMNRALFRSVACFAHRLENARRGISLFGRV